MVNGMRQSSVALRPWKRWQCLVAALAFGLAALTVSAADKFESITLGVTTYSNVTVTTKSRTHVFFTHARGFGSVKLKDLDPEELKLLGYEVKEPPPKPYEISKQIDKNPQLREMQAQVTTQVTQMVQQFDPSYLWGCVAGVALFYLFFCYASMVLCQKTGIKPGLLVWIPVLQIIPLLRAAGMSPWYFVPLFLPLLNFVVSIGWCVKICKARTKSPWLALGLLFPPTSFLIYLYLAFSNSGKEEDGEPKFIFSYQQ